MAETAPLLTRDELRSVLRPLVVAMQAAGARESALERRNRSARAAAQIAHYPNAMELALQEIARTTGAMDERAVLDVVRELARDPERARMATHVIRTSDVPMIRAHLLIMAAEGDLGPDGVRAMVDTVRARPGHEDVTDWVRTEAWSGLREWPEAAAAVADLIPQYLTDGHREHVQALVYLFKRPEFWAALGSQGPALMHLLVSLSRRGAPMPPRWSDDMRSLLAPALLGLPDAYAHPDYLLVAQDLAGTSFGHALTALAVCPPPMARALMEAWTHDRPDQVAALLEALEARADTTWTAEDCALWAQSSVPEVRIRAITLLGRIPTPPRSRARR